MTQMIRVAPVRKTITVSATPQRAFEVFTANMTRWWPAGHTILKVPCTDTLVEPRMGGRWYQIGEDKSECDIGRVLAWEPPSRLLLSWQINADWAFDPDLVTEVEVKFIAEGANRTRVEFEHRNLERFGVTADKMRESIDSAGGWTGILESFRQAAEARA